MIDVVPTILEVCGIAQPEIVDGIKQSPIEGTSFAYTFDKANANAPTRHKTQYFEMFGDHAIYHEGWIASTKVIRPPWELAGAGNPDPLNNCTWELFDLTKDWTQCEDVAAKYPEKVKEMKELFLTGGQEVSGAAAGCVGGDPRRAAAAEYHRRPQRVRLHQAHDGPAAGRFALAAQLLPTPSRRTSPCPKAAPRA